MIGAGPWDCISSRMLCAAVVGFVAYWYNKLTVDRMLLLKALAALQIFVSVINLVTRVGTLDRVRPHTATALNVHSPSTILSVSSSHQGHRRCMMAGLEMLRQFALL